MYMWSSLAALIRGCCPSLCQKAEHWPHHPPAAMASSHFQRQFEFFWSCDCFLISCPFPKRCWITVSKDNAPSSWVNDPQFSNTEQALQRSTKGLGLGTAFSEVIFWSASTHCSQGPCRTTQKPTWGNNPSSFPSVHSQCHSRCPSYSGVNWSFTQGLKKPQTYFSSNKCEQEASFSRGLHPEMEKLRGNPGVPAWPGICLYSWSKGFEVCTARLFILLFPPPLYIFSLQLTLAI